MLNYRQRRLLLSSLKRSLRWEFWPLWLFYIPVGCYIAWLVFRYRGLAFTAVNPGMSGSGFVCDQKSQSLLSLQAAAPEFTALTELIDKDQPLALQKQQCYDFIHKHGLSFPIILKPDSGQRGVDVAIIADQQALEAYLRQARFDSILQEYVPGVEFGVFYTRRPTESEGKIFSLTHKCFPAIVGNGKDTLETLILEHPRLHYLARFLLNLHADELGSVPVDGEQVNVVHLGSHCRGSLFLEGEQYQTHDLSRAVDKASQFLHGFYFGRYDVRSPSIEAFQKGEFKIIEVNGVTSESTNIYDPKYGVLTAYRILFSQWKLAFDIGQQNIRHGHTTMSLFGLLGKVRLMNVGN